jgi:hypothetical protein
LIIYRGLRTHSVEHLQAIHSILCCAFTITTHISVILTEERERDASRQRRRDKRAAAASAAANAVIEAEEEEKREEQDLAATAWVADTQLQL